MIEITCVSSRDFSLDNLKLMYVLKRLSDATKAKENIFLLPREVSFYLTNSLCMVYAFDDGNFVGAACVIRCLDNRTGEEIWIDESRLVVELGSNYILPEYRGNKIGKEFITKRLEYCDFENHFPVSVTSNLTIQKYFKEVEGVLMKRYKKYKYLYPRIRTCHCPKGQKVHNEGCSLLDKEVWMFKNFIKKPSCHD